jgi:hypothetical protein
VCCSADVVCAGADYALAPSAANTNTYTREYMMSLRHATSRAPDKLVLRAAEQLKYMMRD